MVANRKLEREGIRVVIGLYGIQGVYNFGCEAIVRGAHKFLGALYPNCRIIYYSYSASDDKKVLKDLDLEVVSVKRTGTFTKNVINKILKSFKIEKRYLMIDYEAIIDSVDVIVSIGGDIYTIPQVVRERHKYSYYNPLVDFCERAIRKGKEVIVYGASVGPWGNYKKAIDYNIQALSKYKMIFCREETSIEYLHSLGLNNVMFFPDPAFQIRGESRESTKKYIGVNLSPLSVKELYGNYDLNYINKLALLLDELYKKTDIDLMFIPHVLSQSEMDNDLWFMEKIRDCMKYSDHVKFADTTRGFMGVKEYISQCYVVAAARMHCAINAIDENIPAIFLSYSQKSIGMCRYIYGNDRYLISLKEIEKELIDKVEDVLEHQVLLSQRIANRNDEISQYYQHNISEVKKIMKK